MGALVLAACGAAEPAGVETEPRAPTFVQADVDFAIHMGQHHAQSLDLAEPARTKAKSARVKALAAEIARTHADEIDVFGGWMTSWVGAGATMPPHGLDGHSFPGMMKSEDIEGLRALAGVAFDRRFLALMTRHDGVALSLAAHQTAEGRDPEAVRVATAIQSAATRRITEMQSIRKTLR